MAPLCLVCHVRTRENRKKNSKLTETEYEGLTECGKWTLNTLDKCFKVLLSIATDHERLDYSFYMTDGRQSRCIEQLPGVNTQSPCVCMRNGLTLRRSIQNSFENIFFFKSQHLTVNMLRCQSYKLRSKNKHQHCCGFRIRIKLDHWAQWINAAIFWASTVCLPGKNFLISWTSGLHSLAFFSARLFKNIDKPTLSMLGMGMYKLYEQNHPNPATPPDRACV